MAESTTLVYSYPFIQEVISKSIYDENLPDLARRRLDQLEKFVDSSNYRNTPMFKHNNFGGNRGGYRGGHGGHGAQRDGYKGSHGGQREGYGGSGSGAGGERRNGSGRDFRHRCGGGKAASA